MLMQFGIKAQIETLVTLAGTTDFEASRQLRSLSELKKSYRSFLAHLAQRNIDAHSNEPVYAATESDAGKLASLFCNNSALDDKLQSDVIVACQDPDFTQKQARIENALREISLYHPLYADIFRTIVTNIFISPSAVARAGSTSHAIGVIWLNPKLSYTTFDVMEILLHEFTHQTMFLDELRYGHYSYRIVADRSTWAKSAILNISRPLDKVLHSIVVAAEVLLFRERHIGQPAAPRVHPPTEIMLRQLEDSLSSAEATIHKYPEILKPRGTAIVSKVREIMNQMLLPLPASPKCFVN